MTLVPSRSRRDQAPQRRSDRRGRGACRVPRRSRPLRRLEPEATLARRVHASPRTGRRCDRDDPRQGPPGHRQVEGRHRVRGRFPRPLHDHDHARDRRCQCQGSAHRPPGREPLAEPPLQPAAVRDPRSGAAVGPRAGARRRKPRDGLRQVARQARQQRFAEGHVQRCRGTRRGGRGARRDQGLSRRSGQVPGDGREDPQGCLALRSSGNRQDVARQGGRR